MKTKRKKSEPLELTDEQVSRNDDIDNAVYRCLLTLLETDEEHFPRNMEYIGNVTEAIAQELEMNGFHMRWPSIVTEEDGTEHYEE